MQISSFYSVPSLVSACTTDQWLQMSSTTQIVTINLLFVKTSVAILHECTDTCNCSVLVSRTTTAALLPKSSLQILQCFHWRVYCRRNGRLEGIQPTWHYSPTETLQTTYLTSPTPTHHETILKTMATEIDEHMLLDESPIVNTTNRGQPNSPLNPRPNIDDDTTDLGFNYSKILVKSNPNKPP